MAYEVFHSPLLERVLLSQVEVNRITWSSDLPNKEILPSNSRHPTSTSGEYEEESGSRASDDGRQTQTPHRVHCDRKLERSTGL
jgi:hypothetical protein